MQKFRAIPILVLLTFFVLSACSPLSSTPDQPDQRGAVDRGRAI